jgi:hypothetical protein
MARLKLLSAALSAAVPLVTPAMARESHLASRHRAAETNVSITSGAHYVGKGVLAAVALARASVVAATVTAPAVCMDLAGRESAMCGVTWVPIMDPWFLQFSALQLLRVAAASARSTRRRC